MIPNFGSHMCWRLPRVCTKYFAKCLFTECCFYINTPLWSQDNVFRSHSLKHKNQNILFSFTYFKLQLKKNFPGFMRPYRTIILWFEGIDVFFSYPKIFANTVKQKKKINTPPPPWKKSNVFFLSAFAVSVLKKVSDMLTLGFTR